MDDLVPILRPLHAIFGSIALVAAPFAMATRKGGRWHRRWGRAFVWSMAFVCSSAVALGLLRENHLMILVAVFSFHLTASGWRALYLKKLHKGQRPTWVDWTLHGTAGLFNAGLLLWGVLGLVLEHDHSPFYVIFAVFGLIGTTLVVRHIHRFYKRSHERNQWFFDHITGMIAGYIATVSAFSAVNLDMLPTTLQWLWPTLLGTPLIFWFVRKYRQKFARGAHPHDVAKVKIGV